MEITVEENSIFNKFCSSITNETNIFPRMNEIRELLLSMDEQDFVELRNAIVSSKNDDILRQFLYFIVLCRDMESVRNYVNSSKTDTTLIEQIVMFSYSYVVLYDYSLEYVIDNLLSFISHDKLLQLILESDSIANDKLLLFFILSKFQFEVLNKYFGTIKDIPSLMKYFITLPEKILRSIVSRNYRLFQYIMIMMAEGDQDAAIDSNFFNKYKSDIEMFSKLNDLIRSYRMSTNPVTCDPEMNQEVSSKRLAYLVNMLKDSPDIKQALDYFSGENIYISKKEQNIVTAIVLDPLLQHKTKFNL